VYQVIPDMFEPAAPVEINHLDEAMNQLVRQLTGGFARLRPEMNIAMGVLIALTIAYFGFMVICERENWAGGLLKLLGTTLWVYFARDFSTHANAFVNSLITLGMTFGGEPGGDWHKMLSPSHMVAKGFELGQVLLQNLPPWYLIGPTDLLGGALGFVLIQLAFFALAANVVLLVCGYYLSLAVSGVFVVLGILPFTRQWAMRGVNVIVGYGVHLMLLSITATAAEQVLRQLHFDQTRVPAMHEIWSMVFVVGLLTLFAWIAPQRLASSFMAGAVGVGASDAARPAVQTAMMAAGGAAAAVGGLDTVVKALDNRPTDGGPRPSQSIQPTQSVQPTASTHSPGSAASHPMGEPSVYGSPRPSDPVLVRPEAP
jgi:P-type conjugative transfer protein TrbL